jgi:hypothetical protein
MRFVHLQSPKRVRRVLCLTRRRRRRSRVQEVMIKVPRMLWLLSTSS